MDEETREQLYRVTGLTYEQYTSMCQVPKEIPVENPQQWIDLVCGDETVAFIRMPGGIPPMPTCRPHIMKILWGGWEYSDGVEMVAKAIEAAYPWEVEDDDS